VLPFDQLVAQTQQGRIDGLWVSGGYKNAWIDDTTAAALANAKLLVVQDLFPSPLSDRATFLLPAAAYAEREGSYVNRRDHLQSFGWAIRPPRGVRSEGSLFWEMLGRSGLYDARAVLREIAESVLYFYGARGSIPPLGVNLKTNSLAGDDGIEEVRY
jgi:predicted molibdopterin-dependent oxidoreductase YjgC